MADEKLVAYELKAKEDGTIVATLSLAHRQFLLFIAERGGEITEFDFGKLKPNTADHVRKLVEMRMLDERPYVGTTRSLLRLSDYGRNVVTELKRRGA